MLRIIILTLAIAQAYSQNPRQDHLAFVPTIITAWYPSAQSGPFPQGNLLDDFIQILELPINIIIFGNEDLKDLVKVRQKHNTKIFISLSSEVLTKKWYCQKYQMLQKYGLKKVKDRESEYLAYSRMHLLSRAVKQDPFDSNELIWIDFKSFKSPTIKRLLQTKNVVSLITNLKHHFFFVTQPKNNEIHAYPNAEKTYFETNFTTFVDGSIFGGKKQAITTIAEIYDDLLRVTLECNQNLWNEDAVLSMLADRCYYLISYLSLDGIQIENKAQSQQDTSQDPYFYWSILLIQLGLVATGLLLAFQVIKFLQLAGERSINPVHVDVSQQNQTFSGRQKIPADQIKN